MRAGRIQVTDAVHDREFVLVPDLLQRRQVRRKAVLVVEREDLAFGYADGLAVILVQRIVVRYHGVEVVVSARQLQHDQDRIFLRQRHWYHPPIVMKFVRRTDILESPRSVASFRWPAGRPSEHSSRCPSST